MSENGFIRAAKRPGVAALLPCYLVNYKTQLWTDRFLNMRSNIMTRLEPPGF